MGVYVLTLKPYSSAEKLTKIAKMCEAIKNALIIILKITF